MRVAYDELAEAVRDEISEFRNVTNFRIVTAECPNQARSIADERQHCALRVWSDDPRRSGYLWSELYALSY